MRSSIGSVTNFNTRFFGKFYKSKVAIVGLVLCSLILFMAIVGPSVSNYSATGTNVKELFKAPSVNHLLGTDSLGRDMLARVFSGTRLTLLVGICAVFIALVLGTALGLIAGYFGGALDIVISGLMDSLWAFPAIILALAITSALGPNLNNIFIAIGVVYTPAFCRLVRSRVLSIREMEYVMGAKAIGLNNFEVIMKYILPNIFPTLIVQTTLSSAQAVIAEASLSFLGLGVQPPAASLGSMLKTGYPYLERAPWLSIYPGITIMLLVLGLNFLGDGLRDSLDVRIRTN